MDAEGCLDKNRRGRPANRATLAPGDSWFVEFPRQYALNDRTRDVSRTAKCVMHPTHHPSLCCGLEFVSGGQGWPWLRGQQCRQVPGTLFSYEPRIARHITTAPVQPLVR
jgi:hypothetical protein